MAKWYGTIGFVYDEETAPGVITEKYVERNYYGDVTRDIRRYSDASRINENLDINNTISILADAFAYNNFHTMKYVEYMGTFWKVSSVEVQRPRLILTVGGVYNGETSGTAG